MLNKDLVEKVKLDREGLFWYKFWYRNFRLTRFRWAEKSEMSYKLDTTTLILAVLNQAQQGAQLTRSLLS